MEFCVTAVSPTWQMHEFAKIANRRRRGSCWSGRLQSTDGDPRRADRVRGNAIRNTGIDDALRRGEAFKKAGADLLMLFPRNPEEMRHVHERLGGPIYYNVPHGGLSNLGLSLDEMAQ